MPSNAKHLFVWALYTAGIATLLTPFLGVALAYGWRRGAAAPERQAHDRQIRLFWLAGRAWALAFALIAGALYIDIRGGAPVGADKPTLFYLGLLVGVLAQLWFTLVSLWHLMRTLFGGGPRMQAA